jgi:hypothetical protein
VIENVFDTPPIVTVRSRSDPTAAGETCSRPS